MATQVSLEILRSYLQQEGLENQTQVEQSMILSGWEKEGRSFRLMVYLDQQRDLLVLYVPEFIQCQPEQQEQIAPALLKANGEMIMGKFSMDDNGQISLGITVMVENAQFSQEQFKMCLMALMVGVDHYRPLFEHISSTKTTFEQAWQWWQKNMQPPVCPSLQGGNGANGTKHSSNA